MGTIVNIIAIAIGSGIGLIFKKIVNESLEYSIKQILGLCIIVLGFIGVITSSVTVGSDGILSANGILLMTVAFAIGTFIGESLDIDKKVNHFIIKIENKFGLGDFSQGFIPATLLFCCGAMAIIGSINDGLLGDSTVLFTKAVLDGVTAIILAATLGYGVMASSLPVGIYQGTLTVISATLAPYISNTLLNNICMTGYVIVICLGLNMMGITKIKVLNILPALLIPIIYAIIF